MAKYTKYLFIFLSATYFMFAGTGYNIVKYCCKCCENKGVILVEKKADCCDNSDANQSQGSSCMFSPKPIKCFFMRVNTDIPLIESIKLVTNLTPKCIDLCFSSLVLNLYQNESVYKRIYPPPEYKQVLSGRDILALKTVLLI